MHNGHFSVPHNTVLAFFQLPEEVKHFYELALVRVVLSVTAGLFLPLYIYTASGSVFDVVIYGLLSWGLFRVVSFPHVLKLIEKKGVEFVMYLSIILSGVEYALVYFFPLTLPLVLVMSALEGFSFSAYWNAYHTAFGIFGREKDKLEECAGYELLAKSLSIVLPVLSGVFISVMGFHAFFLTVLVATAVLSTYLIKHFGKKTKVKYDLNRVKNVPNKGFFIVEGAFFGAIALIPLYLFVILANNTALYGGVRSLISTAGVVFALLVAKYIDRRQRYSLGALEFLLAVAGISIMFSADPVAVTGGEVLRSIGNVFAVGVYGYVYALTKNAKEAAVGRVYYTGVGKTVALVGVLLFSAVLPEDLFFKAMLVYAFATGLLAGVYFLLISATGREIRVSGGRH